MAWKVRGRQRNSQAPPNSPQCGLSSQVPRGYFDAADPFLRNWTRVRNRNLVFERPDIVPANEF